MKKNILIFLSIASLIIFSFSINNSNKLNRDLNSFEKGKDQIPFDRNAENFTPIIDSHVHFMPFGGEAIPFSDLIDYFRKTNVRFVNVYGIGQRVPIDSDCTYYLDCPGVPVLPTIKNDIINAENFIKSKPKDIHLTISMTFPDLANPGDILKKMEILDDEYPNVFNWMGEVNLIKQALLNNFHEPAILEDISKWKDFMGELNERKIPINIHSDLGNNQSNTKYLFLMEEVLKLYPNNKIVWAHMGLSKELSNMNPNEHIKIMKRLLNHYPNLMLDITWRVLEDNYFKKYRDLYVNFFNNYSEKILPGTDFVASANKNFDSYKTDLMVTSEINKYLNDKAFRDIVLGNNYFRLLDLNYEAPIISLKK